MKAHHALWMSVVLAVASSQALAQTSTTLSPYEEFGKHLRAAEEVTPLTSTLFGDQTSLYSGATEFDVTDIDIPGNSELPVRLGRRLVVDDRRLNPGYLSGFGDWDVEVPYIDGTFVADDGWAVQTAQGAESFSRCSLTTQPYTVMASNHNFVAQPTVVWDGNQLHIPGETTEELLKNTESKLPAVGDGNTYPWVTKSFYRATCASSTANGYPGESFIVVSPTGLRYTFNWAQVNPMSAIGSQAPNPAGAGNITVSATRSHVFLLATEVDDRFGNWVKYAYDGAGHLTQITANDGRAITVNWSGSSISSAVVSTSNGASRTWTYGYAADGSLHTVTKPDNSAWTYTTTSGSLITTVQADGEPPPEDHCQIDPDPNIGSMVYTINAPSGAQGVFTFNYQRNKRTYVPKSCTGTAADTQYPLAYDFFDNFALTSKQITGAGLPTENWSYSYGYTAGGYVLASAPYSYPTETYIPQSATAYAAPKVVTVTGPTEIIKYSFGVNYGVDEGRLYETETDSPNGTVMRTVTNTYVADNAVANQNFPDNAGQSVQPIWKNPMVARLRPQTTVVTAQVPEGDTYTRQIHGFDVFTHPTDVVRSNSIGYQQSFEERTAYFNDYAQWVIGLTQEIDNLSTGGEVETLNTYNSNATLASSARFGETLLSYGYNAQGQLASFTDGDSHTTALSNYYRGIPQLISYPDNTTQSAVVDDYGEITSVTDQNGNTTSYTYDMGGRVSGITYPANDDVNWYPTTIAYNFVGSERGIGGNHWRLTRTTGSYQEFTYFDAKLQPILTDSNFTSGGAVVAGSDITTEKQYDFKGQTTFASYPVHAAPNVGDSSIASGTHNTYDALERLSQSQQDSELGTLTTTTAYTANAHKVVTDPNGNVTTTFYQVFDQPSYDTPIQVVAPTGITQNISRDLYGNPTQIYQSGTYNGQNVSLTRYLAYDSYHRLCRTYEPESNSTIYSYDGANNIAWLATGQAISGDGTVCGTGQVATSAQTTRTYDAMNRIKTETPPAGTQSTSYQYDATGKLTTTVSGIVIQGRTYDKRGLLTGESQWFPNDNNLVRSIGYGYDAYGHLSTTVYPDGGVFGTFPNPRGWATLVQGGNTLYASNIGYYPDGGTANYTFNTGVTATIQRNARQLPSNITYSLGGNTLFSEAYVYDADANLTRITDLVNGKNNQTLGYDGLNRLTSAVAPNNWGTESFTYDPLNNIRSHVAAGLTLSLNYDGTNRLATETQGSPTGGGFANFQYDVRGNQTQSNVVFTSTPHTFDAKNQMLQIPGVATYSYDEAGRRIKKVLANGQTSYFFYSQAGQLMYEYNATAAQPTDYLYLNGKLIARYMSGQNPTDLLTDRLGTPVREIDSTGAVAQSFSYRPFGQLYSGPSQQQPGYTGHVQDPESSLNYMQARYQDGGLGQFLSVDPIGPTPGDVLGFNRYDYGNNNPVMHTDPDGRDSQNVANQFKEEVLNYSIRTVENIGSALITDASNMLKSDLNTHTYTASVGLSGTVATPLGAPFLSPSVGLTGSFSYSLNSHGQSALNGSIGPVGGSGGGASGGVAFGAARTEGGAVPSGFSFGYTNHVEGDFSAPGEPVSFGLSADWNKDGFSASSGMARLSYGPIIFAGVGKQVNVSYTFKKDGDEK